MTTASMMAPRDPGHCPACGQARLSLVRAEAEASTRAGTAVTFLDEWTRCEACGEEFFTYEQSQSHSRARTAALRSAEGLISPDQIRATRIRLGMTQEEFERALGVGRKTVVRWERGSVPPSKAANGLLWVAMHYPSVFLEYASGQSSKGSPRTDLTEVIQSLVAVDRVLEQTGEFAIVSRAAPKIYNISDARTKNLPAAIASGGIVS